MTAKTTAPATVGVGDQGQESVSFNRNNTTAWDPRQLKNFPPADPGLPFLQSNGITMPGLLQNGKNLIVPAAGPDGQVHGCQVIEPNGKTHFSGKIEGCYFIVGEEGMARLGNQRRKPSLFVCTNLADAGALFQATGQPAFVSFTPENMETVSRIAGKRNPGARVILDKDLPMEKGIEAVKKVLENPQEIGKKKISLAACSLFGKSEKMEKKMQDDIHVLGKIALLGELTVWYAPPNAGKTLLVLYLLTESIKAKVLKGENVFYINADDSYKGIVHKLKIAERWGFHQIVPGQGPDRDNIFQAKDLINYLRAEVEAGTAQGRVVILDTVKKFCNMMSKEKTAKFFNEIREFCLQGGTAIMLAHVNKHRDEDKKVVYEGVGDSLSDSDCSYTLDILSENFDGIRVVKFQNQKFRGYVEMTASYSYDASPNMSYAERIESVRLVDQEELKAAEEQRKKDAALARDKLVVDAITEAIRAGINTKTKLIDEVWAKTGLSRSKIQKVLLNYTGQKYNDGKLWFIDKGEKRTIKYQLNFQYHQKVSGDEI